MAFVVAFNPIITFRHYSARTIIIVFPFHLNDVAFHGDHTLDDRFVRISGRYGHDDVATFNGTVAHRQIRQEHHVAGVVWIERGLHGYAVHPGHGAERIDYCASDSHAEDNVFYSAPRRHRQCVGISKQRWEKNNTVEYVTNYRHTFQKNYD